MTPTGFVLHIRQVAAESSLVQASPSLPALGPNLQALPSDPPFVANMYAPLLPKATASEFRRTPSPVRHPLIPVLIREVTVLSLRPVSVPLSLNMKVEFPKP